MGDFKGENVGVSLKYVVSTQIEDGEYVSVCVRVGKLP